MKSSYVALGIGLSLGISLLAGCGNNARNQQDYDTRSPALSATLTPPTNNPAVKPPVTPSAKPNPTEPAAKTFSIAIKNFSFSPSTIYVTRGTTITWINYDTANHTVTADSNGPKSPALSAGKKYSYTFKDIGTFPYHCQFHPTMVGTIVVTP